ncbi:RNA polymerase sigma factor [Sphingobacterium faecium]|uniref:RNA polymerase sigma factor n=1 Tax=Sphingobacterium faecium TaxID=34087 RepID=UPI00247ACF5B|nr:sigma-70 family RNA polymerase sigma factor [Sphingobacterium faecium]WGQ15696.1 sigma-70 family RNA polymerase sigma factor [Sphingobacterium faecium]
MSLITRHELKEHWNTFVAAACEEAFYQIYEYYHHYLSYVGTKRGFAIDIIQDAINDVFLHLWENRAKSSSIHHLHNYIITIFLRKLFRDDAKKYEMIPTIATLLENCEVPSVEDGFIQRYTEDEVGRFVKEKVDELGEKQRLLIYQKFYLGLSYQEIAAANGISINTVYNTIYKSVDKLRNLLTAEQETFLKIAIGALSTFFLFFLQNQ